MDCSGGVLKLLDGFWYDAREAFSGETAVYPCLTDGACTVENGTALQCPLHATGPLCAICDDGYVPDSNADDGSCKICASSMAGRWTNKGLIMLLGAGAFFAIALIVLTRPEPALKIDKFLVAVMVRVIIRRMRKRVLRRLHERERAAPGATITRHESLKYMSMVKEGKFDAVVEFRRAMQAAHSLGAAVATVGASATASGLLSEESMLHAAEQVEHTGEEFVGDAIREVIGEDDLQGEEGLGEVLRNARDGEGGVALFSGDGLTGAIEWIRDTATSLIEQIRDMFDPGQIKIMMGNLQINASLTVVFEIPWPPIHTKFLGFLSVFKLDIFKGLSFAAPCLHSNHFMSLASFIATPIVLIGVFGTAFLFVTLVLGAAHLASPSCQACLKKLPCGRYSASSARTAALKVAIIVILFIYPTICSKVFMTFKCTDVGASGSFMVADMAIPCYGNEWVAWAAVSAMAMLIYVVGIPVTLVLLLYAGSRHGTLQYPPAEHRGQNIHPHEISRHVKLTSEFFSNRLAFGNLYLQYEPKFWWFEFFCTMRKMILTGALVLFSAGTAPQVVVALTVCILWFGLVSNLKPFESDTDDRLAQVEGLQVLFTLMIGLVLQLSEAQAEDDGEEVGAGGDALGVFLIVLNVVVVCLALIQQPVVRKMMTALMQCPRTWASRKKARLEWARVVIAQATDYEYEKGASEAFDWCDASSAPRLLALRPVALIEASSQTHTTRHRMRRLSGKWGEQHKWYFDSHVRTTALASFSSVSTIVALYF
jgi:hypothetical protein